MAHSHEISIGKAAKAAGVSVKTIRYYEELGLIPKAQRHDSNARTGGNRLYSEIDIGRLRFIHHARMLDLGLDDIHALVAIAEEGECVGTQSEYHDILKRHLDAIDERMSHLQGLHERIEALLSQDRGQAQDACSWNSCECFEPGSVEVMWDETQQLKRNLGDGDV